MTDVQFHHDGDFIEAKYHESLRHSYMRVWRNGAEIVDNEIFCNVPEYESPDGLKEAAIQGIKDYDRVKKEVAEAAWEAFDELVAEFPQNERGQPPLRSNQPTREL